MKREIMEVEKERFSLKDNNLYLVQGSWNRRVYSGSVSG